VPKSTHKSRHISASEPIRG